MNASNEKINPIKPFLVISKIEVLLFCILLGLMVILSYCKILNLTEAFFALFVFALSIHFFVFQKRASTQSILMLSSGILFLLSGFFSAYRDTLSFPMKEFFYQISGGIFNTAGGLMVIAFSIAMIRIIQSNSPSSFIYCRYLMLMWFGFIFLGSVIAGIGIYSFFRGLQYL
jgi:hypothetical protein